MNRLSHIGSDGRAQMVDVSAKPMSIRVAVAKGKIKLLRKTLDPAGRICMGFQHQQARLPYALSESAKVLPRPAPGLVANRRALVAGTPSSISSNLRLRNPVSAASGRIGLSPVP